MSAAYSTFIRPSLSLGWRELIRFLRQGHRIVGALGTPIVFWILIGAGMGHSFKSSDPGGDNFMQYFYPGTLVMILLFTAIFSTISIIEDRREGFMQGVLVAPVSRMAIVAGKLLGGTILATAQGIIFLLLAPLIGVHLTIENFLVSVLVMLLVSFALSAVGFCIAWPMTSSQGFHAIVNLFMIPLWLLSGALFPADGAHGAMQAVMAVNPLTYGVSGLRRALYNGQTTLHLPSIAMCLGISFAFALVMFLLSSAIATRRSAADLA